MKTCPDLKSPDKNVHVGMIRTENGWMKSGISGVAQFIGESIRRGYSPAKIAKSVNFKCCNHRKQEGAGCFTCLCSVKRVVRYLWRDWAPSEVLDALTKARKPKTTAV